jgi:hypothetical protein
LALAMLKYSSYGAMVGVLLAAGCGSSSSGDGGGGNVAGGGGNVAGSGGGGGNVAGSGGGQDASAGGSNGGSSGVDAGVPADGTMVVPGTPGCGLGTPAFCETFDRSSGGHGRAGELDHKLWSGGRIAPQQPSAMGLATGIGPATIPACRAGLPAQVNPDQDTLICEPNEDVRNSHLLVAVGAQNYGQNAYRIRQPFDFNGRMGKIVFDAEAYIISSLFGWVSIELTDEPVNVPSYSIGDRGTANDEGGIVPRNALEIAFANDCAGYAPPPAVSVRLLNVITDYKDNVVMPKTPVCLSTKKGRLNHFEIAVSQQKVEIYATDFSPDGSTFGAPKLLLSQAVNLPFSRGWLSISTHNHATLKYSGPAGGRNVPTMDAWTARWDNVGFDGPVISGWREYEIDDAAVPGKDAWDRKGPVVSIGYNLGAATAPPRALTFKAVDLTGATAARLSMSVWYDPGMPTAQFTMRYRLNGKAWHDRLLSPGELTVLTNTHSLGQVSQIIDVPVAELVAGDNLLELATLNVPLGYPPSASNIDLVLTTK